METQHIRYFLAICEELNFTRAAKKCGVAQPTITVAIQRMERKVGGVLFQRLTHPPFVQPTALGRHLYPICVQISQLLEQVCAVSVSQADPTHSAGPIPTEEIARSVASQSDPNYAPVEARNEA